MVEWILFAERKPKEGWYLITYETADKNRYVCESFYNARSKKFIDRDKFTHSNVIAWAEMPEAYKEK